MAISEENINLVPNNFFWLGCALFTSGIFLIGAVAVMSIQISIGYNHYQNYTFFYKYEVNLYAALPTVSTVLATIVIVNTVVGFLGLFKRRITVVAVNGFISCVIFCISVVVFCQVLIMDSDAFLASLNIPVQAIADPEIQAKVDFIQRTLGCCGSNDYRDYLNVQFPVNMSHTIIFKPDESTGVMVAIMLPATCCVSPKELFCTEIWSTGCNTALVGTIMPNFKFFSIIGGVVIVFDLLAIIFAVFVVRELRKLKKQIYVQEQINIVPDAEEIDKTKLP